MNDTFGSISTDYLPAGYGDSETKTILPKGVDAATMESLDNPDDYRKLFGEGGTISGLFSRNKGEETSSGSGSSSSTDSSGSSTSTGSSTTTSAPPPYRDCKVGNYIYRQFSDGAIEIRPGSKTSVGVKWSSTSQHWKTATAQIEKTCGPYPAGTTTTQDSVWASTLSSLGIDSGGSSASGGTQRGAAIGAGIGAFGAQLLPSLAAMLGPQETTIYDDEAPEMDVGGGGGAPWGLILGGVAVLGVLGVLGAKLAFSSTKDDDEE